MACDASLLAHIEEAEARQIVVGQQLFPLKLFFYLAKLDRTHAAAIRSKFARGVFLERDEQVFWRSRGQGGEELFFKHGEVALQRLSIERRFGISRADFGGEFSESVGRGSADFGRYGRSLQSRCSGFKMRRDALALEAGIGTLIVRGGGSAGGCFAQFFRRFHNGLRAPREPIDFALVTAMLARLVLVECSIDTPQCGLERHPGLLPRLDQRPIERGEQQKRSAPLLEPL